jgi:hypothetical protein
VIISCPCEDSRRRENAYRVHKVILSRMTPEQIERQFQIGFYIHCLTFLILAGGFAAILWELWS